jgi:ketosteroid isomerase-like protein
MLANKPQRALAELDRELIEKTIRSMYDARKRGDAEGWVSHYSPNVRARAVSATGTHGFVGERGGREQLLQSLRIYETEIELLNAEILDLIIDGAHASVRRRVTVRGRGSGVTRTIESFDYLKFEAGLIIDVEQFTDTYALNAARGQNRKG